MWGHRCFGDFFSILLGFSNVCLDAAGHLWFYDLLRGLSGAWAGVVHSAAGVGGTSGSLGLGLVLLPVPRSTPADFIH